MFYRKWQGVGERPHGANLNKARQRICLALVLFAIVFSTCPCYADSQKGPGEVVSYQQLGVYTKARLDKVFSEELKDFDPRIHQGFAAAENSVKLYKVRYVTTNPDDKNELAQVSGLIAVPDVARGRFPVLSYQHGTTFSKHVIPSNPDSLYEARAVISAFAAHGYVVFMPDYIGKGDSEVAHPWLMAASEASASFDMTKAGKKICSELGVELEPALFLGGWSQGAHATMALLRAMESEGYRGVLGAAAFAGPYDLYMLWESWVNTEHSPLTPAFMAYLLQAYERYGTIQDLTDTAMIPPNNVYAKELFDRDIPAEEILKKFPSKIPEALREDFANAGLIGNNAFYNALRQNQVANWKPVTPLRLYDGQADILVSPEISEMAYHYLKGMGADVALINVGIAAGHAEVFIFGLSDAKKWFDYLRGNAKSQ